MHNGNFSLMKSFYMRMNTALSSNAVMDSGAGSIPEYLLIPRIIPRSDQIVLYISSSLMLLL